MSARNGRQPRAVWVLQQGIVKQLTGMRPDDDIAEIRRQIEESRMLTRLLIFRRNTKARA
jgi:hypothetical protein